MKTFDQYDKDNPTIWNKFKEYAFKAIRKGFKNYSSKALFEVIRWNTAEEYKLDGFKVNNNYTSGYARKFMKKFPEHKGFFRTREQKNKSA